MINLDVRRDQVNPVEGAKPGSCAMRVCSFPNRLGCCCWPLAGWVWCGAGALG